MFRSPLCTDKAQLSTRFPHTKLLPGSPNKNAPAVIADALSRDVAAGLLIGRLGRKFISEAVQDLVGPEPLQPVQRLVQRGEFLVGNAADLLHGLDVLLIQRLDDTAD